MKAAHSEVMSLGLILGTNGDPTQMMDSREQLHVDGQRQAFLESPGRARRHSNTDSSAHVQLFTGGFMMGGRGTRLWGALLRRAVRCGAFSACAVVRGKKVPHWLPSRRQRIKSQLRPLSLIIEDGEQRLLGEIKARKRKSARGRAALETWHKRARIPPEL